MLITTMTILIRSKRLYLVRPFAINRFCTMRIKYTFKPKSTMRKMHFSKRSQTALTLGTLVSRHKRNHTNEYNGSEGGGLRKDLLFI